MSVRQSSQFEWPSLLLSNVDAESVFFVVFFCSAVRQIPVLYYHVYTYLLFTNISCFLNLQQNSKKKRKASHQGRLLFHFAFWYELSNFALVFFIHTCVNLCVLIICVICFNNWRNHGSGLLSKISKRESRGSLGSILDFPGIPN